MLCRAGGKPRLQGDLELSRAVGDLQYRPVGLIATPDVAGPWLLRREQGGASGGGPSSGEAASVAGEAEKVATGGEAERGEGAAREQHEAGEGVVADVSGAGEGVEAGLGGSVAEGGGGAEGRADGPLVLVLGSDGLFETLSEQVRWARTAALQGHPWQQQQQQQQQQQ